MNTYLNPLKPQRQIRDILQGVSSLGVSVQVRILILSGEVGYLI